MASINDAMQYIFFPVLILFILTVCLTFLEDDV